MLVLAVTVVVAVPSVAMVAGLVATAADAPEPGAENVIFPPATGSSADTGFTLVVSDVLNAVPGVAVWLFPPIAVIVNPADWKAPISLLAHPGRALPR